MAWVKARLKGQSVFARANEDGSLLVEKGVVEVRYKANDGRKYQARAANLTILDPRPLPDSTCGEAEAVERGAASKGGAPAAPARAGTPPTMAPADAVIAYTDGACSGNPGPAGLGVVLLSGEQRTELSEYLGSATNNIAELTAVLRALEHAGEPGKSLVIHTDSQYSIGVLTKGWKAKANTELILKIRGALAARPGVRLVYVQGHAGVPLNERADQLARLAIETRRTQRFQDQPRRG
jgi:ribonuclease HI